MNERQELTSTKGPSNGGNVSDSRLSAKAPTEGICSVNWLRAILDV